MEQTFFTLINAGPEHIEAVAGITEAAIRAVYPRYYPAGAVDYFLHHHSRASILADLSEGRVWLAQTEEGFTGTGTLSGGEIGRLFVLPGAQGRGTGTVLMDKLEALAFERHSEITLASSLPAYPFYEKRGYCPISYHTLQTANGDILCFHTMCKTKAQYP